MFWSVRVSAMSGACPVCGGHDVSRCMALVPLDAQNQLFLFITVPALHSFART